VTTDAQALKVRAIPEQIQVPAMWHFVVYVLLDNDLPAIRFSTGVRLFCENLQP
jgi:hypothetical protein